MTHFDWAMLKRIIETVGKVKQLDARVSYHGGLHGTEDWQLKGLSRIRKKQHHTCP